MGALDTSGYGAGPAGWLGAYPEIRERAAKADSSHDEPRFAYWRAAARDLEVAFDEHGRRLVDQRRPNQPGDRLREDWTTAAAVARSRPRIRSSAVTYPSGQDLRDAGCWFDIDKVGGLEMTAFRREARWRQHRWAVDELSIQSFGTHKGRRSHPDIPPEDISNGTKLTGANADAGDNFLSPAIREVVEARVREKQPHETLDAERLRRDLLSSMPMAFNLFGEAALEENEVSRVSLAELFGVPADGPSDMIFEWSRERGCAKYTRDRTAFDVALRLGPAGGPRTVVGIETKYHEHSAKESVPSPANAAAYSRYQEQTEFLVAIAEASGVFRAGWKDAVLTTDLRQLWRDHLLALSMRTQPGEWTAQSRYVLIYPSRNVSFADAPRRYAGVLEDEASFGAATIEDVVDAAFAHGGPTKERFIRRYIW